MNNYMIEDFHQKLIGLINNSGLTVGTAYFILKDVLNSLEKLYIQSIQEDKENINSIVETHEIGKDAPEGSFEEEAPIKKTIETK